MGIAFGVEELAFDGDATHAIADIELVVAVAEGRLRLEHGGRGGAVLQKDLADVDEVANGHPVTFDIELGAVGGDQGVVAGDSGQIALGVKWFAGLGHQPSGALAERDGVVPVGFVAHMFVNGLLHHHAAATTLTSAIDH